MNDGYMDIESAAEYLSIKTVTLRGWIKKENCQIPVYRIGKQWRFKKSELDDWIRSGKSALLQKGGSHDG